MKRVDLERVDHDYKIRDNVPNFEPNAPSGDLMLYENGELIGFFLEQVPDSAMEVLKIVNNEFMSSNVHKQQLNRSDSLGYKDKGIKWSEAQKEFCNQEATIFGATPKKPHFQRNYSNMARVHQDKKSELYVKAMLALASFSYKMHNKYMPEESGKQVEIVSNSAPNKYIISELFTSGISNYNCNTKLHMDRKNLKGSYNFIYTKRQDTTGGNLYLPDFDLMLNQCNNSLLVYPAWRDMHGVSDIIKTKKNGYRNTHIFLCFKWFIING